MSFSNSLLASRFNSLVDEAIVDTEAQIEAAVTTTEFLANYSYTELTQIAPEFVSSLDPIARLELMRDEIRSLKAKYA